MSRDIKPDRFDRPPLREQLCKIPGIRHSQSGFVLRRIESGRLAL